MRTAYVTVCLLLLSPTLYATCNNLKSCVEEVSKLTNVKYLYTEDLRGKVQTTTNFKVTQENAELFITDLLNAHGYTRVPFGTDKNTYKIISARDVRYTPTPVYHSGKDTLPNTADYVTATFDLKHATSKEIVRGFRPFMSRYGRIMPIGPKKLLFQDTALNVTRFEKLITLADIPKTKEEMEREKKNRKHRMKLEIIRARHPIPHKK